MEGAADLVAAGTTDARSMQAIIWPAFERDLGRAAVLSYKQDLSLERILASMRGAAGAERPDVVIVSDPAPLAAEGLIDPVGAETDGLPQGWLDPAGRWVPLYVQPVVVIANAHRGPPPATWSDLLAGRLRDRIVFEEPWRMLTTGPALAELSSTMEAAAWSAFVEQLATLRPMLVADNERSVLEVATGSRWVGFSNWNVARRVRVGSPVRHVFLDPTPCVPGFGAVVHDAAHAELGGEFVRWLAADAGQHAYAATGRVPARLELDVNTALHRILPAGVSPLTGSVAWVTDPEPWTERLRTLFESAANSAREGKQA